MSKISDRGWRARAAIMAAVVVQCSQPAQAAAASPPAAPTDYVKLLKELQAREEQLLGPHDDSPASEGSPERLAWRRYAQAGGRADLKTFVVAWRLTGGFRSGLLGRDRAYERLRRPVEPEISPWEPVFDLICVPKPTEGESALPPTPPASPSPTSFRIKTDLARGRWCIDPCGATRDAAPLRKLVALEPETVSASESHSNPEWTDSTQLNWNRRTGVLRYVQARRHVIQPELNNGAEVLAFCRADVFTGMP
jgi:hypothetical protein